MKEKIFSVIAVGNFWGGKYYEKGLDCFFVLASSAEEAKGIAKQHPDEILTMFKGKIYAKGKKPAIRKSDNCPIHIGTQTPTTTTMKSYRKVLTTNGKFIKVNIGE